MAVEMTRLGHPLLSIMVLIGRVSLTPLGGSEPHRSSCSRRKTDSSPRLERGRHSGERFGWINRGRPVRSSKQTTSPSSWFSRKRPNNTGIEAVPYQMRHSCPSLDLAQGIKDISSCQKRGRWATMTSLKRDDSWRLLSPATQAHCLTCEHDAEGYILAGNMCPLPPRTGPMS